jgi:hypothetical protein
MNDLTELPAPKKRGRKPKNNIDIIDKEPKIKKKPGRKPKNKNIEDNQPKLKKATGRKSKNREKNLNIENLNIEENSITKKKPGRKPKNKNAQDISLKNPKYFCVRKFEIIIGNIILQPKKVESLKNEKTIEISEEKTSLEEISKLTETKSLDFDFSAKAEKLNLIQEKIRTNLIGYLECSSYSPIQAAKIAFSNIYRASEKYDCVYIFSLIEKTQENFNKLFTYMGTINLDNNDENSESAQLVVKSYNYKKNLKEKNDSGNINFINIDFNDDISKDIKKIDKKIIPKIDYER